MPLFVMLLRSSILFLASMLTSCHAVCYNDTQAMLMAQVAGEKQLEICAGSTLAIGIPTTGDLMEWSAMPPLVVITDDVEIYCGADKKSTNNCVLEGGVLQLVTSYFNPLLPGVATNSTNNLKITGLTFQGTLTEVSGLSLGNAVAIGAPGTNIVLDDCIFQDLIGSNTIFVGRNDFTPEENFGPKTAEIFIQNSVFRNIQFGRHVIYNAAQTIHLNTVSFNNINYSPLCDCEVASVFELENASTTTLNDVTINDVETLTALVYQIGEGTEFTHEDLTVEGYSIYEEATRKEDDYCLGGWIVETVTNGAFDDCIDLVGEDTPADGCRRIAEVITTMTIGTVLLILL